VHYKSEEEVLAKWHKRLQRINYNNIFVEFSDRDYCTYEHLLEFDRLDFKYKIVFTAKNYPELTSQVWLRQYRDDPFIGNIYNDKWAYRKYVDVAKWLNREL
jgi:uncharacterized protein (DUF1919 family)